MKPKERGDSYFRNCFELPNQGLSSYFARVRRGSDIVLETNFYEGTPMSEVLEEWKMYLASALKAWPGMLQFEFDLAEKVGPMSVMAPLADRMADIEHYYQDISLPGEPVDERALVATLSRLSLPRLKLYDIGSTLENMKKSTNSGSPYFTKRKLVVDACIPRLIVPRGHGVRMELKGGDYSGCAILGHRGQEGGPEVDDVKQRVVWMFPFSVNIAELQLYQPLIAYMQSKYVSTGVSLSPAWTSSDSVDMCMTKMFDTKGHNDIVLCTDFTKFDQHYNVYMQQASKAIINSLFESDPRIEDWLRDIFPIKYMIPIAYDWDKVMFGDHGMASGSGGTNGDETLGHESLQHEVALKEGETLNPYSQRLGDDGCLTFPGLKTEKVVESYSSHGLEMNPAKQSESTEEATYLRRYYHVHYRVNGIMRGVYSTCRALGRLRYYERVHKDGWTRYDACIRAWAILENCKWHPCKEAFAEFCIKGDPFRLGLDTPEIFDDIAKYVARSKSADIEASLPWTVVNSEEYKSTGLSGIKDWWIYRYLQSKL